MKLGVKIAKNLKAIEEIQEAEAEARELIGKAQGRKTQRIQNAGLRARMIITDAETQAKLVLDQAQRGALKEISSKRAAEHSEIYKVAEKLKKKRLSGAKVKRIVDKAMQHIMSG